MKHGNQKYNFEPLKVVGGETVVQPANLYALKSAIRSELKVKLKGSFDFVELSGGKFKVTRTA